MTSAWQPVSLAATEPPRMMCPVQHCTLKVMPLCLVAMVDMVYSTTRPCFQGTHTQHTWSAKQLLSVA
jgi:hypothetical protein